jgi:hypothetical protein
LSFAGSRGTSGQVLTSNGSGSAPTWQNPTWNGGTVQDSIIIGNNAKYFGLRNGATRLFSNADGVLQVQDGSGQLATLDTSLLFVDHIVSASAGGVYIYNDDLRINDGQLIFGNGTGDLTMENNLNVLGDIIINNDVKLHRNAAGVIQILDSNGQLATLDASLIFVDHINSASSGGIYFFDNIRFYSPLNIFPSSNNNGNIGGNGQGSNYY